MLLLGEASWKKHLVVPTHCLVWTPSWEALAVCQVLGETDKTPKKTATLLMTEGSWGPEPDLCSLLDVLRNKPSWEIFHGASGASFNLSKT